MNEEEIDLFNELEEVKIELSKRMIYSRKLILSDLELKNNIQEKNFINTENRIDELNAIEKNHHDYKVEKINQIIKNTSNHNSKLEDLIQIEKNHHDYKVDMINNLHRDYTSSIKTIERLLDDYKDAESKHFGYLSNQNKCIIDDNIKFYKKTLEAINAFRKSIFIDIKDKYSKLIDHQTIEDRMNNFKPGLNYSHKERYFTAKGNSFIFSDSFISTNANHTASEVIDCNEYDMIDKPYYLLDKGLNSNSIVIDIGANIGIFSIYLAKLIPGIKIIAIEPIKRTYKFLLKNIVDNGLSYDQIIPLNLAVIGKKTNKKERIVYLESNPGSSFILGKLPGKKEILYKNKSDIKKVIDVNSITLDDLFNEFNIEKCDLLKIDCEGSEKEIFEYSTKFNDIKYVVGEIHHSELNEDIINSLLERFPNIKLNLERV